MSSLQDTVNQINTVLNEINDLDPVSIQKSVQKTIKDLQNDVKSLGKLKNDLVIIQSENSQSGKRDTELYALMVNTSNALQSAEKELKKYKGLLEFLKGFRSDVTAEIANNVLPAKDIVYLPYTTTSKAPSDEGKKKLYDFVKQISAPSQTSAATPYTVEKLDTSSFWSRVCPTVQVLRKDKNFAGTGLTFVYLQCLVNGNMQINGWAPYDYILDIRGSKEQVDNVKAQAERL